MDVHNKLISKYNKYFIIYEDTNANAGTVSSSSYKHVISVMSADNDVLLRITYVVLGSYSSKLNIWYWGNVSPTLDFMMNKETTKYRNLLNKVDDITSFSKTDWMVISSDKFFEMMKRLEKIYDKSIIFDINDNIYIVILVDDIIYDKL